MSMWAKKQDQEYLKTKQNDVVVVLVVVFFFNFLFNIIFCWKRMYRQNKEERLLRTH